MESVALFLDIDGTLIDIASTPDQVVVPTDLGRTLQKLYAKLDGALALVTGRSISNADRLLGVRLPVAGLHGAEIRDAQGLYHRCPTSLRFDQAKKFLKREVENWNGLLIEDKGAAIALHFRQNPELQPIAGDLIVKALNMAGPNYAAQRGRMVVELKPAAPDKGKALRFFMKDPSFAERRPICFGDDLTDESMFVTARNFGGLSVSIGRRLPMSAAVCSLPTPQSLRKWLESRLL